MAKKPAKRSRRAGAKTTLSERALLEARMGMIRLKEIARRGHDGKPLAPFNVGAELHPPIARPKAERTENQIAMDSALTGVAEWAQAQFARGLFSASHEGMAFLGYPELSILAQRPEYRVVSETLATEMTRKWVRFTAKEDEDADDEGQADRVEELKDYLKRIDAEGAFRRLVTQDGFFGRGHLYLDTGDGDKRDELVQSIGDGEGDGSEAKVNQDHKLEGLRTVEAVWTYPTDYNSNDPLSADWYNPTRWFVMGKQVHRSRLRRYVGREVPDMLKPAYSFGGLSLTQMLKPYVDNWLRTRQSVADIISSFSVFVLKTDLMESLQAGGEQLFQRAELFNVLRDNAGVMMLDMDTEDFSNVSASLATLDALQAQTQEHMAAVARIPIVKLLGIQPAGLNADSEGIMRSFYDNIAAEQKKLDTMLGAVIRFAQLSLWGKVDTSISHEWEPLHELNEKEQAEVDKIRAETGDTLIGNGTLHPEEERKRIATDPATRYTGLDIEDVPDPVEEGPEPENIKERISEGGGEQDKGAGDAAVIPFAADAELADALDDAEFVESQHPRDAQGKFAYSATSGSPTLIHPSLKAAGFKPGKTSSGKPVYVHPTMGHKVVIEPPTKVGGKYSSKYTLYEHPHASTPEQTHKGEGSAQLKAKLYQLGHKPPAEAPPFKGAQPVDPTGAKAFLKATEPSQTPTGGSLKFKSEHWKLANKEASGKEVYQSDKTQSKIVYNPATTAWWYYPGHGGSTKSGQGVAGLATMGITAEAGEPPKQPDKWNDTAKEASKLGFTLEATTSKTQKFEVPGKKGTVEINPETGEWLAISPGHVTKTGTGLAEADKLFKGLSGTWANAPGQVELYPPAKPAAPAPPKKPVSEPTKLQTYLKNVAPEPNSKEGYALGVYGGSGYQHINDSLRKSAGKSNDTHVKSIDEYLGRSEIPQDVVLYRKVGGSYAEFMKSILVVGTVFTDHGFSSTSTHPGTWHGELHFVINVPKGTKGASIAKYTGHSSENEVLLPRGTVYKVTNFDHSAGKAHLDIVAPEGAGAGQIKTTDAAIETPEDAEPVPMSEEESERYTWHEGDIVILEQPDKKEPA